MIAVAACFLLAPITLADQLPICYQQENIPLDVNNEQVLQWSHNLHGSAKYRAHVKGVITQVDNQSLLSPYYEGVAHSVFHLRIGEGKSDEIMLYYNLGFGALPKLKPGMHVEACGEYTLSTYPSSSAGEVGPHVMLLHMLHHWHDALHSGYLKIDNVLYGQKESAITP